jgi:HEAT repeat protein
MRPRRGPEATMNRCARRSAVALLLGPLLVVVSSALGQTARPLDDWRRDLRDPAVEVRARAVQALGAFERQAVPALTSALGDREYRVRASAVEALVKMPAGFVVPGMIEALRSPEVGIRANAAVVLGAFGPAATPAAPALAGALKDPNIRVRELAGEALNRIAAPGPNHAATLSLNCH